MFTNSESNLEGILEDMQKGFDVNVYGTLRAVYAFLPLLQAGEIKKVVAISSGMGDIGEYPSSSPSQSLAMSCC